MPAWSIQRPGNGEEVCPEAAASDCRLGVQYTTRLDELRFSSFIDFPINIREAASDVIGFRSACPGLETPGWRSKADQQAGGEKPEAWCGKALSQRSSKTAPYLECLQLLHIITGSPRQVLKPTTWIHGRQALWMKSSATEEQHLEPLDRMVPCGLVCRAV